jgi:hypothetical protein
MTLNKTMGSPMPPLLTREMVEERNSTASSALAEEASANGVHMINLVLSSAIRNVQSLHGEFRSIGTATTLATSRRRRC